MKRGKESTESLEDLLKTKQHGENSNCNAMILTKISAETKHALMGVNNEMKTTTFIVEINTIMV
jgi:hypothetical protein